MLQSHSLGISCISDTSWNFKERFYFFQFRGLVISICLHIHGTRCALHVTKLNFCPDHVAISPALSFIKFRDK